MPVEDEINFNAITDEQLDALEAKADRAEKAKKKIDAAMGGSPQDIFTDEAEAQSGGIYGGEQSPFIGFAQGQKITGGVRNNAIRDRMSKQPAPFDTEMDAFVQQLQQQVGDNSDALELLKAEVQENKRNAKNNQQLIGELRTAQQKATQGIMQGLGAARDPFGFMKSQAFGMLAKVALPVGAIIMIVTTVIEMIKKEFGPGGLFDVRKLVVDEVRQFNSMDDIIKMDRGEIYLGTQATLAQLAPDIGNGENKVIGFSRDILRNEGDYRRATFD